MSAKFKAGNDQSSLVENMETLTGQRGDGRNRAVTYGELAELGLANIRRLSGGKVTLTPGSGTGSNTSGSGVQKPTKPTNFTATGGFAYVLLEWDMPTYRGRSLTEIYRSPEDNLANAVLIASSAAGVYGDPVDPSWKGYYWIRHVNALGEPGPYNAAQGIYAETKPDATAILDLINEELNTSPLIESLNEKITVGTQELNAVYARVDRESDTRTKADEALGKRVDTVSATLNENSAAVQQSAEAIARIDESGSAAYQAQWSTKAQAGDIQAGIGIVARQDASGNPLSQVAIAASQFFVFDPNNPNDDGSYSFPFVVNSDGKVVIDELLAKEAVIKILSAQEIVADSIKAGIEIVSPHIKTARIESGGFTVDALGNATFGELVSILASGQVSIKSNANGRGLNFTNNSLVLTDENGINRIEIRA